MSTPAWFPGFFNYDGGIPHISPNIKLFSDPLLRQALMEHCIKERSTENIEFILKMKEIEEGIGNGSINKDEAEKQLEEIYNTYVGNEAPKQVNLKADQFAGWEAWMKQEKPRSARSLFINDNSGINIFSASLKNIEKLIHMDTYKRFIRTEPFLKYQEEYLKKKPNAGATNPIQYLRNSLGSDTIGNRVESQPGRAFLMPGVEPLSLAAMTPAARAFSTIEGNADDPLSGLLLKTKSLNLEDSKAINDRFKAMDKEMMDNPEWKKFWEEQEAQMIKQFTRENNNLPPSPEERAKIRADISKSQADVLFGYRTRAIEARFDACKKYAKTLEPGKQGAYSKAAQVEMLMLKELNAQRKNAQIDKLTTTGVKIDIEAKELLARKLNESRTAIQTTLLDAMKPKSKPLSFDRIDKAAANQELVDRRAKMELRSEATKQLEFMRGIIERHRFSIFNNKKEIIRQLNALISTDPKADPIKLSSLLRGLPADLKTKIETELQEFVQSKNEKAILDATSSPAPANGLAAHLGSLDAGLAARRKDSSRLIATEVKTDEPGMSFSASARRISTPSAKDNVSTLRAEVPAKSPVAPTQPEPKKEAGAAPAVPSQQEAGGKDSPTTTKRRMP